MYNTLSRFCLSKDPWEVLSCRSFSAKEPLIFLQKSHSFLCKRSTVEVRLVGFFTDLGCAVGSLDNCLVSHFLFAKHILLHISGSWLIGVRLVHSWAVSRQPVPLCRLSLYSLSQVTLSKRSLQYCLSLSLPPVMVSLCNVSSHSLQSLSR